MNERAGGREFTGKEEGGVGMTKKQRNPFFQLSPRFGGLGKHCLMAPNRGFGDASKHAARRKGLTCRHRTNQSGQIITSHVNMGQIACGPPVCELFSPGTS